MRLIEGRAYAATESTDSSANPPYIDESAPFLTAAAYLATATDSHGYADLAYWQGDFFRWRTSHYEFIPVDAIRSDLYHWLSQQVTRDRGPVKATQRLVDGLLDALKGHAYIDDLPAAPGWLGDSSGLPLAEEIIACSNGLLHVPTRRLLAHSKRFFTLNAVKFNYMPNAGIPQKWLGFLRSLWPDDVESIETLQEIFGLLLTSDTQYQKIFLIVGPRRAGKGTIARVLTALVGQDNITAPALPSLGMQFGLEPMIGKSVALIADARLGGRADAALIAENLLRISGEDAVTVHRKYKSAWTARLPVRFVLLSNELPALADHSAALPGRFILLRLTRSFFGEEDLGLEQGLRAELPGIFLWALDGLERLRHRGYFRQPTSALQMVRELENLASPVKAFVAECCVFEPGSHIACSGLFASWEAWCKEQRLHAGRLQTFGRDFRAAFPQIEVYRPRIGEGRERYYKGIRLGINPGVGA